MKRKIIMTVLVMALCLSSAGVYADKGEKENKSTNVTVTSTDVQASDKTTDAEDVKDVDSEDVDADEEKTDTKETDSEEEKDVEKGKSKVSKEDLEAKKKERADAQKDAKEHIKEIKALFKDADVETKKEILAEIAAVKKELQDLSIGVFVRGMVVDFEKYDNVLPVIKEDRTLIPIRAIMEAFDATVEWDAQTRTITITKDEIVIKMQIDNNIATVNDVEVTLDVAPEISNNRTMVPVRFISESLQMKVDWDADSKTIVVEEGEAADVKDEAPIAKEDSTTTQVPATEPKTDIVDTDNDNLDNDNSDNTEIYGDEDTDDSSEYEEIDEILD